MSIRDVFVTITRETRGVTQRGFGLPLILATNAVVPYMKFRTLAEVGEEYITTTEAYKMAAAVFAQSPRPQEVAILGVNSVLPVDLTTALDTAVNGGNDDWYFLLCPDQTPTVQAALATWAAANQRLYFTASDVIGAADLYENDRMVIMNHETPLSYPDAAWVGRCAPTQPGSITWKYKILNGILDSGYTNTEISTIDGYNGNVVLRQGGILHTAEGKTTAGEFIDVMRTMDFIEARIKENVFIRLVNAGKVPFTNEGISIVVDGVREALQAAFNQGAIALGNPAELEGRQPTPDEEGIEVALFEITAPRRNEVSLNDRANRILPDINFTAILAGAVHEVRVNGVLKV